MFKKYFLIPLLFFLISSCSLDKLVEKKNKISYAKAPYDAIIIPGYPYGASSNRELFNIRIFWAKTLYERGVVKNIIFSGDAVHTPYTEGKIMKMFADSLGLPEEHLFEENEALHSNQNILKGKELAKKLGFKKIAIATDPYQFSYMTTLVDIFSPGIPLLTFSTDSMSYFNQPLPAIDIRDAFVKNWTEKD